MGSGSKPHGATVSMLSREVEGVETVMVVMGWGKLGVAILCSVE